MGNTLAALVLSVVFRSRSTSPRTGPRCRSRRRSSFLCGLWTGRGVSSRTPTSVGFHPHRKLQASIRLAG